MKTALLVGSTGLVGNQLLQLLLNSSRYGKVVALVRQHVLEPHAKLQQVVVDFSKLSERATEYKADDIFCCLGTTMANAGSKENFYQVDFYYPFLLAKTNFIAGAKQYLLVSALGATKESGIYYNRVKGEVEEAILNVGYETVHIFRPSLLLGPRKEKRFGENTAKALYKIFGSLIPDKYKAIDSFKVAKAMLSYASRDDKGVFIHESKDLQRF